MRVVYFIFILKTFIMNQKISLNALKVLLTPKEMKNVTGGSGCTVQCGDFSREIECQDILDCESQCFALCGDGGWMTNCY